MNRARKDAAHRMLVMVGIAIAALLIAGCIARRTDSAGRKWLDFPAFGETNGVWTR